MSSILAIILARKNSKGLKKKNIRKVKGKELIYWPIRAALKSKYIDDVIVSTDCKNIRKLSKKYGASTPFLRPKQFARDSSSSYEAIKHCLDYLRSKGIFYEYFLLLEPTSPLTNSEDIDRAFEKLFKNKKAKSIVSVSKTEATHPIFLSKLNNNKFLKPAFFKSFKFVRRQNLNDYFYFDGSLYISETKYYLKKKTFNHSKTLPIRLAKWKSIEIDCFNDLICVQALKKHEKKLQE